MKPRSNLPLKTYESQWGQPRKAQLVKDKIIVESPLSYDPFDHYWPREQNPPKGGKSLPYLFLDVHPQRPKEVLRFCQEFGLPGPLNFTGNIDPSRLDGFDLRILKSSVPKEKPSHTWTGKDINAIFQVQKADQPPPYGYVWKHYTTMKLSQFHEAQEELRATIALAQAAEVNPDPSVRLHASRTLEKILGIKFYGFRFRLIQNTLNKNVPNRDWIMWWDSPSLLGLMYLMVMLDLEEGSGIQVCPNSKCSRIFLARHHRGIYCSPRCQNQANVRQWRAAQRKGKKATDKSKSRKGKTNK